MNAKDAMDAKNAKPKLQSKMLKKVNMSQTSKEDKADTQLYPDLRQEVSASNSSETFPKAQIADPDLTANSTIRAAGSTDRPIPPPAADAAFAASSTGIEGAASKPTLTECSVRPAPARSCTCRTCRACHVCRFRCARRLLQQAYQ